MLQWNGIDWGGEKPFYEGSESLFVSEVHNVGEAGDVECPRIVRHPNSHQLFIRNLPYEAYKIEMKALFQSMCWVLLWS